MCVDDTIRPLYEERPGPETAGIFSLTNSSTCAQINRKHDQINREAEARL